MKKISKTKMTLKAAVVIAVALAFILPSSAVIVNTTTETKNRSILLAINKELPSQNPLTRDTDVLISAGNPDEDDLNPKITMNSDGTLVVVYEQEVDVSTTTIPVVWSKDNGASWTMQFDIDFTGFGSGVLQSADIKYSPDADRFFFNSADELADPSMWVMTQIAGDIENAPEIDIMGISGTNGGLAYEGAVGYVGDWLLAGAIMDFNTPALESIPTIGYYDEFWAQPPTLPADSFYFDGQSFILTEKSENYEIATGDNRIFLVMNHFNDTTQNNEVLYKATVTDLDPESPTFLFTPGGGFGGMDKYADIEIYPYYGYLADDAVDPDISAKGSSVSVVYTQAGDVKCSYSSDDGDTWDVSTVETGAGYPAVYVAAEKVYCTYVKEGNLFLVDSDDGGATWGDSTQINDEAGTVVAELGTADLGALGIVWTDSRNTDLDVYFEYVEIDPPEAQPEIQIKEIIGGIGVSATITNVGEADATDVECTLTVTGGILGLINKEVSETLDIAIGEEVTISTGLILGLGAISITATADNAEETVEGTQIIIFSRL